MTKLLIKAGALLLAIAMVLLPLEFADARGGGRGGAGRGGSSMGRSSRGRSRGKKDKAAKADRERDGRENADGFKRDAADDAE